ncbi:hypothetical protein BE11_03805 [Sorangium cellulosum]|nr:hypothetical protein BE11_03805 [Sorangium cellulosum]
MRERARSGFVSLDRASTVRAMPNAARIALMVALGLALPARASADDPRSAMWPEVYGEFSASSLLAFGLMPVAGLGFSSTIALRWFGGSLSIESRALKTLGSSDPRLGERSSAGLGVASICRHEETIFLCQVLQIGALGTPIPPDVKLSGPRSPWIVTFGGRGGTDWRISRHLYLRGFIELHVIPMRPVVQIGDLSRDQSAYLAALAGLGLTVPVDME